MGGVLEGLMVVELGDGLSVGQVGNVFADFGAEVITIEPPRGVSLRREPGFLFMGRGKKSVVLDCHVPAEARQALGLMAQADVIVTSVRHRTLKAWGLDPQSVLLVNPRAVVGIVTGWGLTGPLADVKGHESLVMASIGGNTVNQRLTLAPGPNYITVPWAAWSASQTLLHGIFAALRERETSGLGQMVHASLAHSLGAQDPWGQANAVLTQRFPEAFTAAAPVAADGSPNSSYTYKLLVAITKDGHWLQFSQVMPRLFRDFMSACGLDWMYEDPKWKEFMTMGTDTVVLPSDSTAAMKMEFWDMLLDIVKSKTLAEWNETFDQWPNVFAEVFRRGTDLLHHPQLEVEGQLVTIKDRRHGDVLMPGPLIRLSRTPAQLGSDAPHLDEHGEELRARAGQVRLEPAELPAQPPDGLPLAGVTIMELGTFYAAPHGSTMLTDLGARVIKIEPIEGDPMRTAQAFPEAGGMKVLQGKESLALNLGSPEAREILAKVIPLVDIVMCSFRMGVAERLGVTADELIALNPQLMYLDCPGFGILPPYGARPAFAPTMSAGSGLSMRNVGTQVPEGVPADNDAIRLLGVQVSSGGGGGSAQPDGVASFAVGSALAMAAYLQAKGVPGQSMLTTMLQSCGHCLGEMMVEFEGRWEPSTTDDAVLGMSALLHLYETSDGWVSLAAPSDRDWQNLTAALAPFDDLATESRFANSSLRAEHDALLGQRLAAVFAQCPAEQWQELLLAADVGCLTCVQEGPDTIYVGPFAQAHGWLATVDHPMIGEYPRLGPYAEFSRSRTVATVGGTNGQHTRAILEEVGFDASAIEDFAARGVVLTS